MRRSRIIFRERRRRETLITRSMVFLGKMKVFPLVLIIIMAFAGLSACAQNNNNNNPTQTGPVTFGVSLSLTGDNSADGQAIQQGYNLWVDYINSHGGLLGHQIKLIVYDDGTKTDQTRVNYEKLITVDKVNFVLGPFQDVFTVNAAEVAARHGYVLVQGTGTSNDDFTHGLPNIFSVSVSKGQYMTSLVNYILSPPVTMRPKTLAHAGTDNPFVKAKL